MSDLLRVVERSQDHAMDIEDYLAREQLGEAERRPDRAAPGRRGRVSVAAELRTAAAGVWEAQHAHPFVRGIGDGSLDEAALPLLRPPGLPLPGRLRPPARARRGARPARGGDAPLRGPQPGRARDRDGAARRLRRALGDQRGGARGRAAAPATAAYTNFLLRTAALGDYAELVAALLPCVWGYAEIGARLAEAGMPDHAGYTAWIAVYADPEFQALAAWARELTEAAGGDAGPGARERMHAAFGRRASTSSRSGRPRGATRSRRRDRAAHRPRRRVQATPVVLDAEATVAKACRLLGEAAAEGAELAVLPETFVALYPSNAWAGSAVAFSGHDELWERLWMSAVDVPGPLVDALAAACAEHAIHCAIGVNERESERPGSLYNTLLLIGPDGLLHKHRKLMPTMQERIFHGVGAGRRPRRHRDPGGQGRRPDLLGEPDAARPLGGVSRRPADLGRADRRRLRRLAGLDAPHRDRVRRVRRVGAAVHPRQRVPGRLPRRRRPREGVRPRRRGRRRAHVGTRHRRPALRLRGDGAGRLRPAGRACTRNAGSTWSGTTRAPTC